MKPIPSGTHEECGGQINYIEYDDFWEHICENCGYIDGGEFYGDDEDTDDEEWDFYQHFPGGIFE